MATLSIRCVKCGASLHLDENSLFITCHSCGSSVDVERTKPGVLTTANVRDTLEKLNVVGRKNKIQRLYREYVPGLAAYQASRITQTTGVVGGLIFMLLFTSMALCMVVGSFLAGAPLLFQIVPGGFALIGILTLNGILKLYRAGANTPQGGRPNAKPSRARRMPKLAKPTKN